MAKIVNTGQAVLAGVTAPKAVYSRRVSCWAACNGGAARNAAFTRAVGQDCWLLGVDLWGQIRLPAASPYWMVAFRTSFSDPDTVAESRATDFIEALNIWGSAGYWFSYCSDYHFHWDLSVRYTGAARRFGFDVLNAGTELGGFMASFLISEG